MRTRTHESDEAKMARFLHRLNDEIPYFVEMFPYDTLQDVVRQAIRVEKKNMCNGHTCAFQGRTTTRSWQRAQQPYGSQFEGAPPRHPHASTASSLAIRNQDKGHQLQQEYPLLQIQKRVLHAAATFNATSAKEEVIFLRNVQANEL